MKKVLVVVDMQKDFVDGALGTAEAVGIVDNVVRKIENFCGDIIVTMDTHHENYMETREGKYLPVPHCIQETAGWMLDDKVRKALEKKPFKIIEKRVYEIAGCNSNLSIYFNGKRIIINNNSFTTFK